MFIQQFWKFALIILFSAFHISPKDFQTIVPAVPVYKGYLTDRKRNLWLACPAPIEDLSGPTDANVLKMLLP